MKSELKKVQWPSFKQTMNNTGIVILCVIVVGIFIWLFDAVAGAFDRVPARPVPLIVANMSDGAQCMWSTPIPDTKIR